MQHDHVLKKWNFDLLTPSPVSDVCAGGGGGGSAGKIFSIMLLYIAIPFNLIRNMTMFWKKIILTHWPHSRGGGWGMGICVENICYHLSAFVILFYLIRNMALNWKIRILTYWLIPRVGVMQAKYLFLICCNRDYLQLKCNMTMFCKSGILTYCPHP